MTPTDEARLIAREAQIWNDAIECAAALADAEAGKMRQQASECRSWSMEQAERLRAKDSAMNIADAIRALATKDEAK